MADWCTGLTDDQKELLDLNWPGILSEAEAICGDPAGEADELITAGVTTFQILLIFILNAFRYVRNII